jgi:AraC-like DNA-binding protein
MNSRVKEKKLSIQNVKAFLSELSNIEYSDDDIALFSDVHDFPYAGRVQLDMAVMGVCRQGSLQLDINGERVVVTKDYGVYCNYYKVVGNMVMSPDFKGEVLCISLGLMQRILHNDRDMLNKFDYLDSHPLLKIDDEERSLLLKYYDLLKALVSRPERLYHKEIMVSLIQSALYSSLSRLKDAPVPDNNVLRQSDLLLFRFRELLAKDNGLHLTVDDYAKQLCITPKYLASICTQKTGHSASDLIREKTVERVRFLLTETTLSIKEISNELGFPNMSFFGTFVKRHLGLSPVNYRNKMQNKE